MLHAMNALLAPAAMERLTLVFNHVLSREPAAMERLRPHAGRVVKVLPERWPGLLPAPPALAFRVTPAGLLEWCGADDVEAADLSVHLDASDPARLAMGVLAGDTPTVRVEGNAQLATDVNWLLANVRWDVADDLHRLFGPGPAQALQQLGRWLSGGLRGALQRAAQVVERMRPSSR